MASTREDGRRTKGVQELLPGRPSLMKLRLHPLPTVCIFRLRLRNAIVRSLVLFVLFLGVATADLLAAGTTPTHASVDTRFELVNIVARLAGYHEFGFDAGAYGKAVDDHFRAHRDHPAVQSMRRLRASHGVGFDAVPNLAAHLGPVGSPTPVVDLASAASLDSRWGATNAVELCRLLADFHRDAECAAFFKSQAGAFAEAGRRLDAVFAKVDMTWYDAFFGRRADGRFHLVVGMLNGNGNFSATVRRPDGSEDLYASIGAWQHDNDGAPVFADSVLPLIIHEYGHCFVNRLVMEREADLRMAGERIFPRVADEMRRQAYGAWRTLMIESMVRACVIQYAQAFPVPGLDPAMLTAREELLGFVWTGDLVRLLDRYKSGRARYPALRDFMPEVVRFMDAVPDRLDVLMEQRRERVPKFLAAEPFGTGAKEVDETTPRLTLRFDRELRSDPEFGPRSDGSPFAEALRLGEDRKTLTARLNLKPGTRYEVVLPGASILSSQGYPALGDVVLSFSTRGYRPGDESAPFGYVIEGDDVVFSLRRPAEAPKDFKIQRISVAGEFNGWNPKADGFTLETQDEDLYRLRLPKSRLGDTGSERLFKFVVNDEIWLDPPSGASNRRRTPEGHVNLSLVL